MKLYKENMGFFINAAFWVIALFTDPIWILIKELGVVSLALPVMFGWLLANFEKDINWKL